MNFCRTFRNTALKEIGKNYTVQGGKFLLSSPPLPPLTLATNLKQVPHIHQPTACSKRQLHTTQFVYIYILLFYSFVSFFITLP